MTSYQAELLKSHRYVIKTIRKKDKRLLQGVIDLPSELIGRKVKIILLDE